MDSLLAQSDWMATAGIWVGLGVALLIFSAILGDHWFARLGQHVLVGAALGYAAAVTWHAVWQLSFLQELAGDPFGNAWHWFPIVLAALLAVALVERILFQGEAGPSARDWRRWLRAGGLLPAALIVSVGVAVSVLGLFQGTLAPQFLRAAQTGFNWGAAPGLFITGLLTLLITTGALVFFTVDPQRHLAGQPRVLQQIMRSWIWVGQRAVWLAAGAIFARLAASRFSLLIAQFEFFRATLTSTGFWQALVAWSRGLGGG